MGWVDVKEGVNLEVQNTKDIINYKMNTAAKDIDTFKQGVSDTIHDSTLPVREIAGNVSGAVNDFQAKGNREGYGEAIWQDVVQPVAGTSTARGAILGAGGALAADLVDPTPGINPMNIAGGGLVGAAVGTAAPYAYDAVQALSSPNSLLRGETYSRALEGAGIASGITGEVDQGIQDMVQPGFGEGFTERGLNIAKNVTEGAGNAYSGALAGVNQLGADVSGFIGWDSMQKRLDEDAQGRRDEQSPNSAVGAVAQELSYDAGMGGVLGKAAGVAGDVAGGAKRWFQGNMLNAGIAQQIATKTKAVDKLLSNAATSGKPMSAKVANIKGHRIARDAANSVNTMYPGAKVAADLVGTFSKSGQKFLETNWNGLASIFGSGKAASRYHREFIEKVTNSKMLSNTDKDKLIKELTEGTKLKNVFKNTGKKAIDQLITPVSSGTAKLFGTGTAITADVED